jgi:hypothetical protein
MHDHEDTHAFDLWLYFLGALGIAVLTVAMN